VKTATQLKDKIKNLAKEKNLDPLILSKNYMMEHFLDLLDFPECHLLIKWM